MPELCERCRHRRARDQAALEQLRSPIASPSARDAMQQQFGSLRADIKQEDIAFKRSATITLGRRPLLHDWCAAQSQTEEMTFYFCDWLNTPTCAYFQCSDAVAGCVRCETGQGPCTKDRTATVHDVATAPRVEFAEVTLPPTQAVEPAQPVVPSQPAAAPPPTAPER